MDSWHGRNRSTTVHQARRIITTGDHFSTELTAAPSSQMSSRLFHLSFFKKLTSHLRACQMEVQTASNSMIPKISPLQYKNGRLGKSLSTYGLLSYMSTPQKKHPSLVRNSSSCLALKRWTAVTNRSQNWWVSHLGGCHQKDLKTSSMEQASCEPSNQLSKAASLIAWGSDPRGGMVQLVAKSNFFVRKLTQKPVCYLHVGLDEFSWLRGRQ